MLESTTPALKRPESVLVILHDAQGSVLLLQRADDPAFWQSVTGTIEWGEHPLMTAYREVEEETGIRLEQRQHQIIDCRTLNQYQIRKEWWYRYGTTEVVNDEYVFIAQIPRDSVIQLTEHTDHQWLAKAQAVAKVWSPSNQRAIEQFVPCTPYRVTPA